MDNEPFAYTVTYLPPDLGKQVTVPGLRRKALMELKKAADERRKEIQAAKNED